MLSNIKQEVFNSAIRQEDEALRFQQFPPNNPNHQQDHAQDGNFVRCYIFLKGSDENIEYYHEYMRLYIANVVLTNQLKELLNEKNELLQKLSKLEKKNQEISANLDDTGEEKRKRIRRAAQEIERHFKCPIETCQKQYGYDWILFNYSLKSAEGSLNQHIKLKHPEYFKEKGLVIRSGDVSQAENKEQNY